jgi:flagellar basal-body rod protein FlgF
MFVEFEEFALDAMTIASIAMQDDLQRMNNISQNLTNVTTLGYKRQIAVGRPFSNFLQGIGNIAGADATLADDGLSPTALLDMRAGTLRQTGNPLDLAVEGAGFFEVATDQGPAYCRQGTMRVDPHGHLVTQQGFALMGVNGDLKPNGGAVSIDAKGEVRQGDRVIGQIKLVNFANPNRMVALGNGLFGQGGATPAEQGGASTVRSGFQENSNVSSAQEMVRLTETVRHFESMQKVMQGYGDVFDQTLRKLGEF